MLKYTQFGNQNHLTYTEEKIIRFLSDALVFP